MNKLKYSFIIVKHKKDTLNVGKGMTIFINNEFLTKFWYKIEWSRDIGHYVSNPDRNPNKNWILKT